MNRSCEIFDCMKANQLIALLSPVQADDCIRAYEILKPLGIILEIALRTPVALAGIQTILKYDRNALILAGTVMTTAQAERAISEGIAGIVSADYLPALVDVCLKHDIMYVPGGLADAGKQLVYKSEILHCSLETLRQSYPYQWIYKLFPAVTAQIPFYQMAAAWKGPYKDLTVIYTGGISRSNLPVLFQNDPQGIYCGSALTKDLDQPLKMSDEARCWIEVIREYKTRLNAEDKGL